MSCNQALEMDLPAFLADPRAAEFEGFRGHYPGCASCSAEVRAWTELQLWLSGGAEGTDSHPAPELLLRFEDAAGGLPPAERNELRNHLESCTMCRDELQSLRAFDFTALDGSQGAEAAPSWWEKAWAGTRAALVHPALAYALALALLYPAFLRERLAPQVPSTALLDSEAAMAEAPAEPASAGRLERAQKKELAAKVEHDEDLGAFREAGAKLDASGSRARERRTNTPGPTRALDSLAALEQKASAAQLRLEAGSILRIPVPENSSAVIVVRVVSPDGRRELRERLTREPTQSEVSLELPPAWLEPGLYSVVLTAPSADVEYGRFVLSVR